MVGNLHREAIEKPSDRVIVALDGMNWAMATEVMIEVRQDVGMAKANSLAQKFGWKETIQRFEDLGALTMADAKYKDIPSTMENHLREITECAPALVTIFADNEFNALKASVFGRNQGKDNIVNPLHRKRIDTVGGILGVTVLTSYTEEDSQLIYGAMPEKKVIQFAHEAAEAGLDGIVCSPKELKAIRKISMLNHLITVVPGITPAWAKKPSDQSRVSTPTEAIQDGADFLVIGRAITKPPQGVSRAEAASRIAQEIKEAL